MNNFVGPSLFRKVVAFYCNFNSGIKMNKLFSIMLIFVAQISYSQEIVIKGHVQEDSSNEPIEYATLSVFNYEDSTLLGGTITDENGNFEVSVVAKDALFVVAQFIGYATYQSDRLIANNMDLGLIELGLSTNTLSEIEVTGRGITSLHKIDKQVYDAGQFQNAKGGTAADVLRNLPSVSINSFGEISVRGATGFLIMINNKAIQGDPTLILQQLSSNTIEDIEIVTAPSAKYDPDGNAGIINIKTKEAVVDGRFLVANIFVGLPSIESYDNAESAPRYGADFTFNYKQGKWDYSIGANYRKYHISGRREGYVNTYLNNILTEFPSDGERSFDELTYSARAGVSYTPNKNQQLTAGIYAGKRSKDRTADILYKNQQMLEIPMNEFLGTRQYYEKYLDNGDVYQGDEVIDRFSFFNENLRIRKSDFFIGSLDYSIDFSNKSSLKIAGLYERTILGGPTDNVNLSYPNVSNILELQFNVNNNPLDGYRFKIDYSLPTRQGKWESGYQFRYLQHPGVFEYLDLDLATNQLVENPLFTNRINLTRGIHSLYSQHSGKVKQLTYTAGLRLEHFNRTVEIANPDSTYLLSKWNLFPSLNLSYALNESLQFKAGYSRRIERTTTFKMTPFPEREHSETLEQGDARLLPEYIDLIELGLIKSWNDNSVFGTLYFRNVKNVINRVNTVFNQTILNRIYTNVGNAQVLGLEIGTTIYPTKKWRLYAGGNIYNYGLEGQLFGEPVNTSNTIYSLNINSNHNFTPSFNLQLAFNYLSERVTAQGRDSEFYNPSLSLKKSFMDNKISVGLQWLNIDMGLWNANEQRITTEKSNFYTTTNYVYEVDIVQLSFTYQFNQPSKNIRLPDSEFGKKEF